MILKKNEREPVMNYLFYLLACLAILSGCGGPRYSDFFLYRDDGTMKPKVVFLPVTSWEQSDGVLGQYFTNVITHRVRDHGELFFYESDEVQPVLNRASGQKDLSTFSLCFRPADFVVETLIIQDGFQPSKCVPLPCLRKNPMEHVVRLRLQIVDVRQEAPKIVLLETLEEREIVVMRENGCSRPTSSIYETLADRTANRIEEVIQYQR